MRSKPVDLSTNGMLSYNNFDNIKKSCTCTDFKLEKHSLKPNENNKLTIIINTTGKVGYNMVAVSFIANSKTYVINLKYKSLFKHN